MCSVGSPSHWAGELNINQRRVGEPVSCDKGEPTHCLKQGRCVLCVLCVVCPASSESSQESRNHTKYFIQKGFSRRSWVPGIRSRIRSSIPFGQRINKNLQGEILSNHAWEFGQLSQTRWFKTAFQPFGSPDLLLLESIKSLLISCCQLQHGVAENCSSNYCVSPTGCLRP